MSGPSIPQAPMEMEMSIKPTAELNPEKLIELLSKGTRGPWRIDKGLMGDDLRITAYEREGYRDRDGDGPICRVSKERYHFEKPSRFGRERESRSWRTPIQKAGADAELIVAAINALPELLRRLNLNIEATAWLIEWAEDRHGPTRYYSPGEPPVIDPNNALRFARKEDAERFMHADKFQGAKATEHLWLASKSESQEAA